MSCNYQVSGADDDNICAFDKLNGLGMNVDWITSENDKDGRCDVMRRWVNSEIRILVSTIQDGIDNSKTKHVWLVGGSHCLVSAVEGVGRIRPRCFRLATTR